MSKAISYEQIYDFETPCERLLASVLSDVISDAPDAILTRESMLGDFQKPRPNISVRAMAQLPLSQAHMFLCGTTSIQHIDIMQVAFNIQLATEVKKTVAKTDHPLYRARIRMLMATLQEFQDDDSLDDNQKLMPFHRLCRCWPTGMSSFFDEGKTVEFSTFHYSAEIAVIPGSWPED